MNTTTQSTAIGKTSDKDTIMSLLYYGATIRMTKTQIKQKPGKNGQLVNMKTSVRTKATRLLLLNEPISLGRKVAYLRQGRHRKFPCNATSKVIDISKSEKPNTWIVETETSFYKVEKI